MSAHINVPVRVGFKGGPLGRVMLWLWMRWLIVLYGLGQISEEAAVHYAERMIWRLIDLQVGTPVIRRLR